MCVSQRWKASVLLNTFGEGRGESGLWRWLWVVRGWFEESAEERRVWNLYPLQPNLFFILTMGLETGQEDGKRRKLLLLLSLLWEKMPQLLVSQCTTVINTIIEEEITNYRIIGKKQDPRSELGKAFCKELGSIKTFSRMVVAGN